ncbi:MAG: hypothetical protein JKY23_06065 [Nitrospinaceae bacterium]|nr:hypothetical protein [Nitrospinaceae bacterium]
MWYSNYNPGVGSTLIHVITTAFFFWSVMDAHWFEDTTTKCHEGIFLKRCPGDSSPEKLTNLQPEQQAAQVLIPICVGLAAMLMIGSFHQWGKLRVDGEEHIAFVASRGTLAFLLVGSAWAAFGLLHSVHNTKFVNEELDQLYLFWIFLVAAILATLDLFTGQFPSFLRNNYSSQGYASGV